MTTTPALLAQAYCDVLFAYIDRLSEPSPEDPLESIVREFTSSFSRVAACDERLNKERTYFRYHGLEPWPAAGTALWLDEEKNGLSTSTECRVQSVFEGTKGHVFCVLEVSRPDGPEYLVRKVLELRPAPNAPTFLEAGMENEKFAAYFTRRSAVK